VSVLDEALNSSNEPDLALAMAWDTVNRHIREDGNREETMRPAVLVLVAALALLATPATSATVILMGAGDIAIGSGPEVATALLIDAEPSAFAFTAGDNAYDNGSTSDYVVYNASWGAFKSRTRPCPGNHEYHTAGAAGYFGYFGAQAGPSGVGYFSYNIGDWHCISLDSEVDMSPGSPQETWLRADLAANTALGTLAYWHRPTFSSGDIHGSQTDTAPLWKALQDFGADIVICGHDHEYERFALQTVNGVADPVRGIREFVVGTGGANLYTITTTIANSEVHDTNTYGVLRLTLGPGTYAWQFVPIHGQTFTDSGNGVTHHRLTPVRVMTWGQMKDLYR